MLKPGINRDDLHRIVLIGGVALFLAGCSPPLIPNTPDGTMRSTSEPAQAAGTEEAPASPTEIQMTTPAPTPSHPGLQGLIETARADLAQRLSISVNKIVLVEAKSVVWPDASLGCPQPGMAYKQVPQDGALIRLDVNGRIYQYHSGGSRAPFLCERRFKSDKSTPLPSLEDE